MSSHDAVDVAPMEPTPAETFDQLLTADDSAWLSGLLDYDLLIYTGATVKKPHSNCRAEYAHIDDMCLSYWARTRSLDALRVWWLLPRLLLRATERGGTPGAAEIRARCKRMLLGGMQHLYHEAMEAAPLTEPPQAPPGAEEGQNSSKSRTRAAEVLIRQGQLSRGMARLLSDGVADVSEGTDLRLKLEAKFPAHPEVTLDLEDGVAQDVVVDEDLTETIVRLLAKAKAADLSGRRNEHVQAVVAETGTATLAMAIHLLQNVEWTRRSCSPQLQALPSTSCPPMAQMSGLLAALLSSA